MKNFEWLKRWFIIPNGTCPVCGRILFSQTQFVCGKCYDALKVHHGATCAACGRLLPDSAATFCRSCLSLKVPTFDSGYCHFQYLEGGRSVIHKMKFDARRALCRWAGMEMLAGLMTTDWFWSCDVIVPVPISESHLKIRGYNQSALIVEGISAAMAEQGIVAAAEDALMRIKDDTDQIGSTRAERLTQLKGAFAVVDPIAVKGKNVLLVDDVITTGATLKECADMLRQAGAEKVYVATCAG